MKCLSLFFFLLSIICSNAQNIHIVDSEDLQPLSGVSIVAETGHGTITNADGVFDLSFSEAYIKVTISHISYQTQTIERNLIQDTIRLQLSPIRLDEVTVSNFNAKDSLEKAIRSIPKNYVREPYNSFGFFRQSLEEDGKGVEMIEVSFIGYYNPTSEKKPFQVEIRDGKKTDNLSKFKVETVGGVLALIEGGDFVRNQNYFLDLNKMENYVFSYEGFIEKENDSKIYIIAFEPSMEADLSYLRQGKLFIHSESFAIVEIDYRFDEERVQIIFDQLNSKNEGSRPKYLLKGVSAKIKYSKNTNNKWSLSYVDVVNDQLGVFQGEQYLYSILGKLVITNNRFSKVYKAKTNYNLKENFTKSVKEISKASNWDALHSILMSDREKEALKNIFNL
ncbi:carboxypeptidase-like regulatory domain-containing protein [Ascidiimonas aurantiaca]|uniref:carboxypeptidase-like regulatory domain-containing protein n=1 Tax=Ascidiimonas aurantiaca TaxID=1685432 RepID=UPI0030ECF771